MSKEEKEFLDQLRARSVGAAADMMAGVQRLKVLHEDLVGEDAEEDRLRLGDYLYKLAKLELEHASNILSLGNTQAEMLFEHVRRLVRRSRGASAPLKVLEISAPEDDKQAIGRLEVRNPFERDADARFEMSTFRRPDGVPGPELATTVRCAGGVIAPYATAVVELTVATGEWTDGDLLYAELTVYLSALVEKEVACRVVKLKREARR